MTRSKRLQFIRDYWTDPKSTRDGLDAVGVFAIQQEMLILLEELTRLEAIEAAAREVDDAEDALRSDVYYLGAGHPDVDVKALREARNETLRKMHFVLARNKRKEG
jgi:hypothetical protein